MPPVIKGKQYSELRDLRWDISRVFRFQGSAVWHISNVIRNKFGCSITAMPPSKYHAVLSLLKDIKQDVSVFEKGHFKNSADAKAYFSKWLNVS